MRTMLAAKLLLVSKLWLFMLVLLSSTPMSARADASTGASFVIDNLRYELTDLDPNDGITPSLTFVIDPNARDAHAIARAFGHFGEVARDYSPWLPAGAPSAASLSFSYGSVNASLTGLLGSTLSLQGSAVLSANDGVERSMSMRADSGPLGFVLSPMSAVTWRTDIEAHGATLLPSAPAAGGLVFLEVSMAVYSDLLPESAVLEERHARTAFPGKGFDLQETFEITLSNRLATDTESTLVLNGFGSIASAVSPVPEPANWALLLAGAGLMSTLRRRRRPA